MSTSSHPNYDLYSRIDPRVAQVISRWGLEDGLYVFDSSTASSAEAASSLSVDVDQIGKSIAFKGDDWFVIVLISGALRVDKAKVRAVAQSVKMASIDGQSIEKNLGYRPGGLSPLFIPDSAKLFVDRSIENFETIYVSAGTTNSVVALSRSAREAIFGSERFDLSMDVSGNLEEN